MRNRSSYKEVNIAVVKRNKDKAGVKKALKSTIDYLIKQEKKIKRGSDYNVDDLCYAKSAKLSPVANFISANSSKSALFTDYGFSTNEFNDKFATK